MVESMAPMTEAHPLAAQTHGTRSLSDSESILMPNGKGIPRRMPRGTRIIGVTKNLKMRGRYNMERRMDDTLLYSRVRTQMVSNISMWPVRAGLILSER